MSEKYQKSVDKLDEVCQIMIEKNKKQEKEETKQIVETLKNPQRIIELNLSIRMDNGDLKTFKAFRVQHSDVRGPFKGGVRFHPEVNIGEVKSLAFWMSLKGALLDI